MKLSVNSLDSRALTRCLRGLFQLCTLDRQVCWTPVLLPTTSHHDVQSYVTHGHVQGCAKQHWHHCQSKSVRDACWSTLGHPACRHHVHCRGAGARLLDINAVANCCGTVSASHHQGRPSERSCMLGLTTSSIHVPGCWWGR